MTLPLLSLALVGLGAMWFAVQPMSRDRQGWSHGGTVPRDEPREDLGPRYVFPRRFGWLMWLLALLFASSLYYAQWPLLICISAGITAALILLQIEYLIADARTRYIETQLADSIDIFVSGMRSGSPLLKAFEYCANEAPRPLRFYLLEAYGRLRYAQDPKAACRYLVYQLPYESFRLFSTTLALHLDAGGQLAAAMMGVARSIRDRLELAQRLQSLLAQVTLSTIVLVLLPYVFVLILYQQFPGYVHEPLKNQFSVIVISVGILLQGVGVVVMRAWSTLRY